MTICVRSVWERLGDEDALHVGLERRRNGVTV
jgi:hypothetical protein